MRSYCSRVGPNSNMTGELIRRLSEDRDKGRILATRKTKVEVKQLKDREQ